eukprot:3163699-Rhodomonas_salina.1
MLQRHPSFDVARILLSAGWDGELDMPEHQVHREGEGVNRGLDALAPLLQDSSVLLLTDCLPVTLAVEFGSKGSNVLQAQAKYFWRKTLRWNITFFSQWIPGSAMCLLGTDGLSQEHTVDVHNVRVSGLVWYLACQVASNEGWILSTDLFADQHNAKCRLFWSVCPSPGAFGVDAFSATSWGKIWCNHCNKFVMQSLWVFPPIPLLALTVARLRRDRARGILLTPRKPCEAWWSILLAGAKKFFDLSFFTVFEFVGHTSEHNKRKSMYSSASWTLCLLTGMHRQRFGVVASVRPQPSNSTPRSISGSSTKSQAPERARAGLVPAQNDRPHSSSTLLQRQKYIVVDVKPSDAARSSAVCAFRSAARQSALKSLLPGVLWSADAFSPTLASLEPLKRVVPFELHGPLLQPPPDLTALEIADGKPLVAFLSDGSNAAASGIDQLAAFFDSMVPFATEAVRTRISYWMAWRQFVSFLFLKGCVLEAFPASDRAIRAFLAHLLLCGYAGATYDRFYAAIVQRHRAWGGMLPIQLQKFRAWIETIQKQLGVPKKLKFAILPEHLRAIFLLQRTTITDCRDVAIIGSGTIYALRPSEVIGIDTCDLLWDEDGPGTHAFDILRRKKDQTKHGLRPRAEKAQNPDLCILAILAEYQK